MSGIKYVGMDVHQATTVVAVLNGQGRLVQRSIVETKAETLRDFVRGLSGTVRLTFEEGAQAAWLHDLFRPLVAEVLVCTARAMGKPKGTKSDEVDAERLARRLRMGELVGVYHGEHGTRTLKQLARTYGTLVDDSTMVMNRIKAIYRGLGIASRGKSIYLEGERAVWLGKLGDVGMRYRAETLMTQLIGLVALRKAAKAAMVKEAGHHAAFGLLTSIPGLGPVRAAQLVAVLDTPHRFRSKRALWAYAGLAVVRHGSSEYRMEGDRVRRVAKASVPRGLNQNGNRRVKEVFKGAATTACRTEPFATFYKGQVARGLKASVARVSLARKIAAVTLAVWRSGKEFDATKLTQSTT